MLLSVCVSYMFQVICLNHYLVFELEVVVMAECQMFRLSCLQRILMWIYWWMRRKFLIKSTVQSKTPLSFDEVLKPVLLIAQSWSSVPHAALQRLLFGSSVGLLFWVLVWETWQAMSCPVPGVSHSPWVLLSTPFCSDSSEQNLTSEPSCALGLGAFEAGWNLTAVHWWSRQNHSPQRAALLSVTPGNRITVPAGKK